MKIGDAIKQFRDARGLSMDAFAKRSGLSKAYISLLEKGVNNQGEKLVPSITTLRKVANAMGADVNDLIGMLDEDSYITIEEPTPLIYADDDFEVYSSSRRLQDNAEPFIGKTLLSMTEPCNRDDTSSTSSTSSVPSRDEIFDWLNTYWLMAADDGTNIERYTDEELLDYYYAAREAYEEEMERDR